MASEPDAGLDRQQVDHLAGHLVTAITAVVEFGRGTYPEDLFREATLRALVYAQAALIIGSVEPDADDAALFRHECALRAAVADYRSDG